MAADVDIAKHTKAHEDTYGFFTGLMKWGAIASFVAAMIVVLIIAN